MVQGDRVAFGEDIVRADVATFLADVAGSRTRFGGPGFTPHFKTACFLGATMEIYNDSAIPPGTWSSRLESLTPDLGRPP